MIILRRIFSFIVLFCAANCNTKQAKPPEAPVIKSGLEMIQVQGGTYVTGQKGELNPHIGCTNCSMDECAYSVKVSVFGIGKYEVTQADWQEVMNKNPSLAALNCAQCPVENVSWNDVQIFIKQLNARNNGKKYRLPTESEWEWAARGGNNSKAYLYAGGNDLERVAWFGGNANQAPHPVGTKRANELGIYDMTGNVWEWCQNTYLPYPCDTSTKTDEKRRALRGGSWNYYDFNCRLINRYWNYATVKTNYIGLRLAED